MSSMRPTARPRLAPAQSAVLALLAGLATVVAVVGWAVIAPAGAESPLAVAEEVAGDGVFVAPGREIDEAGLIMAVQEAQARGQIGRAHV